MKKLLLLAITGILVINGYGTIVFSENDSRNIHESLTIHVPSIQVDTFSDNYMEISLENSPYLSPYRLRC